MKRKSISEQGTTVKRVRQDREPVDLTDYQSVREQAEPYRLATARLPIDALTPVWSIGSNRPIDTKHVQNLCRIFEEQHLQREAVENRLRVACSRAEVEKMMAHCRSRGDLNGLEKTLPWPSFEEWVTVNGSKAELMAGQHRVEALKILIGRRSKRSGATLEKEQSWWICDIYDKDRLPSELNIRLRANHNASTLPDSHGQVWARLVALVNADHTLFRGNNGPLQKEMLERLDVSGRSQFPMRRLVTLWKNASWYDMITRWCQTSIGRATFNVSLWEEMARCRVDDFWFDTFDLVLEEISQLTRDVSESIQISDWNILTRLSPSRSAADVHMIFYPEAPADVLADLEARGHKHRRLKFLTAYDHATYHRIYQHILKSPDLRFPDIQALLRVGRQHGKILSQVMNHVAQWLNPRSTQASGREHKTLAWHELLPAFSEDPGKQERRAARSLQRQIFDIVRDRIDEFTKSSYLSKLPETEGDAYLERFSRPIWRDLLVGVHKVVGIRFHRSMSKFNTQDPKSLTSQPKSTLMEVFKSTISGIPQIRRNPALNNSKALEELMTIFRAWAMQQCEEGLQARRLGQMPPWPSDVMEIVASQQRELDVAKPVPNIDDVIPKRTSLPTLPDVAPKSMQSERYDGENATEDLLVHSYTEDTGQRMLEEEDGPEQLIVEETPKAISSSLDALLNQAVSKPNILKQRRSHLRPSQGQSVRSVANKAGRHQGDSEIPRAEPREGSRISVIHDHFAKPRAELLPLATEKKTSLWRDSPAARLTRV